MIELLARKSGASIRKICSVLGESRSSFYHAALPTKTQMADRELGQLIEQIFYHHRRRCGYRRIVAELADLSIACGPARVRRIMAQRGLHALQPKTFTPKTSDGRADKPSANLLKGQPLPTAPNQAWAGDITFIPLRASWLYLAVVIDLYSRRIIGWSLANHMRSDLVLDALKAAIHTRAKAGKLKGALFHSDRGSQYSSTAYRNALAKAGMRQSMSARANPYHNAWTESFIGTLKHEMLRDGCFDLPEDAQTELFSYIEAYYNTHRKHSSLNYQSPSQFEAAFYSLN